MTDEELSDLQACCDAASRGPWFVDERDWQSERSEAGLMIVAEHEDASLYDAYDAAPTYEEQIAIADRIDDGEIEVAGIMHRHDGRFLCRARDAMPALIAEIRRLRDEMRRAGLIVA
jgi:hypothetical protein